MVSGDDGAGAKLARVTYLPGVVPPSPEADEASGREAALPDFATFFGEDPAESSADSPAERAGELPEPEAEPLERGGRGTREVRVEKVRVERVSMHALTRRGMSRWELEKTLLSREIDEQTVLTELDRLEAVGLLDDAALAETLVRTQHERKGLGRGALTAELRRRHIDQEHIDAALEQVDDDDEQTRATELAVKRASQLSSYDLETAKRRLTAFLMRKGYSSSVVRAATEEALSSRSGGPRSGGVRFR
ncbi:regulatory protein RecX [Lacisediminihabitans profunda]|uniref:Regulatory protein RecX n=1 Tax=Lacisediminihabitans profunda TaxID=2594790 RepID=A0A5C8USH1_9MICO|nr:regulatory protein RecX [Lacisediminihabitans profunda]TXN31534.1 regulatory protein RecX [Lacisediminihabitans profunda]